MAARDRAALLAEVGRRLLRHFGRRRHTLREEPLGSLVWTVLSQNTTDLTAERAYRRLRRSFPSWRAVRSARRGSIEAAVRVSGLARQKARTIQEFLARLERERGRPSLAFLRRMPADRAMEWLTASPGIGPKTAAVVLLFACGRPVFPVDTHIRRVAGRVGLVPEGLSTLSGRSRPRAFRLAPLAQGPEQRRRAASRGTPAHRVQEALAPLVPRSAAAVAQLHLDMIWLGRRVCHPRDPECPVCPLRDLCRYALRRRAGPREE